MQVDSLISEEIKLQMSEIKALFCELVDTVSLDDLVAAEVYKLPLVPQGEEHKQILEIPVQTVKGKAAYFEALRSFSKFNADKGVSTKSVFRMPGFIQLATPKDKIQKIINQINERKFLLKSEVQKINGAKKKHDFIHSLYPGLITKQVYRKLYAQDDISSLSFIWANKFVTNKTSKKEVVKLLNKHKTISPMSLDLDDWISFIDREIETVESLPGDAELRFKRPAKVTAVVNLDSEVCPQLSAHLPVIVLSDKPITVKPLRNFDAAFRRCVRSDSKIGGKPIISRLHLYLKKQ